MKKKYGQWEKPACAFFLTCYKGGVISKRGSFQGATDRDLKAVAVEIVAALLDFHRL
jgi:hypothetical protein